MKDQILLFATCCATLALAGERLDLSGDWQVKLDSKSTGEESGWFAGFEAGSKIHLPGIVTEIGLGEPLTLKPALTKGGLKGLKQRHKYVGAAWYSKTVELSREWENQKAVLLLERTIWETTVWVNGQKAGSADSLSVPHRYAVGEYLQPGKNTLVIRVDNSEKMKIGIGHAYTEATQTIWNGIIGRIELSLEEPVRVADVRLAPQPEGEMLPIHVYIENRSGKSTTDDLIVQAVPVDHDAPALPVFRKQVTVEAEGSEIEVAYPIKDAVKWSEFNPALYGLEVRFGDAEQAIITGFRTVAANDRELLINGKPSFMRGTLECCIFPKTGYPPMDEAGWDKVFDTAKAYGLNHIRFHSWCPPEAAFASADRNGIYLQVELPNWSFGMGWNEDVDAYFKKEGERIFREYGHHPSFVFFSLGNELKGDLKFMDGLVKYFKELTPHLLYTSTSFAFSPRGSKNGPEDDFFVTQRTQTGWVRGQGFINQTKPTTDSDYREGLKAINVPLITHEVGQYNVYPNLAELPKYDGNLRAVNFEAIRNDLAKKGRLLEAADYTLNSGKLAALLYKEDLERALRTKGQSGIQLLDLHDFPGQSTATVGLLDAFWDSKGIVTPEEFRRFCAPVVPLARMPKMTWKNSETFTAELEVANFSEGPLNDASIHWQIADQHGTVLAEKTRNGIDLPLGNGHPAGAVEMPLDAVSEAGQLKLTVSLVGTEYSNSWNFWVYPEVEAASEGNVVVIRRFGPVLLDALENGKKVLFLPPRKDVRNPLDGRFIPVFWSPLHFPDQPGSLGTMIDADHPIFNDFPTSTYTDWQWWELLANSFSVNADELGSGFSPIMRFIDKYNRNSLPAILWEANVGSGKLLVCTLEIESEPDQRIAAAQLKHSMLTYMNSEAFAPKQRLDPEQLKALFRSGVLRDQSEEKMKVDELGLVEGFNVSTENNELTRKRFVDQRLKWAENNPDWNPTRKELEDWFDKLDGDDDGLVTPEELNAENEKK